MFQGYANFSFYISSYTLFSVATTFQHLHECYSAMYRTFRIFLCPSYNFVKKNNNYFSFRFNQLSMQNVFIVRKKLNLCIAYSSESKKITD
jgi:hypothetical protein